MNETVREPAAKRFDNIGLTEQAFKVVRVVEDSPTSGKRCRRGPHRLLQSAGISPGNGGLVYTPGEIVRPFIPRSKLFAFDEFNDARRFVSSMEGVYRHEDNPFQIWTCLVENMRRADFICKMDGVPFRSMVGSFEAFWRSPGMTEIIGDPSPKGSVMGDSIELLNRVWPDNG